MPSMTGASHAASASTGSRFRACVIASDLGGGPERPLYRGDRFFDALAECGRSPVRQAAERRQAFPADLLYPRGIAHKSFDIATRA